MTGYTFPQLSSMATTLPGLLRVTDVLLDAYERLAASPKVPSTAPTKPQVTAPIQARSTPTPTKPLASPTEQPEIELGKLSATPINLTKPRASPTERTQTHQVSLTLGEVYVFRGAVLGQPPEKILGRTNLGSGDEVRTGPDGKVVIGVSSGQRIIQLAPKSSFKYGDGFRYELGVGRARVITKERLEIGTPTCVVAVRGTEFTVSVNEDGTTTVTALQGLVDVRDLASNASVTLEPSQTITVPKVPGGLQQQDMRGRVRTVTPASIERWWEGLPTTSDVPTPIVIDLPFGFIVIDSPFTIGVAALVTVVVLTLANILWHRRGTRQARVNETSAGWLEILKTRLAKGEITAEQYEELKNKLRST